MFVEDVPPKLAGLHLLPTDIPTFNPPLATVYFPFAFVGPINMGSYCLLIISKHLPALSPPTPYLRGILAKRYGAVYTGPPSSPLPGCAVRGWPRLGGYEPDGVLRGGEIAWRAMPPPAGENQANISQ